MRRGTHTILLLGVIILNALLAYQPHFSYPFPLLGDEYAHLSFARYIIEERELPLTNPYFRVPFLHINFESGFHVLLAGLLSLSPATPLVSYKFLVLLFSVVNSVLMYTLVRQWTASGAAALIATFFFGTIKSTNGFLSHQYALPLSAGMSLLLLAHILFHRTTQKQTWPRLISLGIVLVALAFTYPPALFFFVGTVVLYALSLDHSLHMLFGISKKTFLCATVASAGVIGAAGMIALHTFETLNRVVFTATWDIVQTHLSPVFFFGIIPSTLAAIGIYAVARHEHGPRILIYWFFGALGALYVFYLTSSSVLVPFPRLFLFYLMGVSALAGIGGAHVLRTVAHRPRFILLSVLLVGALGTTHYVHTWEQPLNHRYILNISTYRALQLLDALHPGDAVVIADSLTSLGIYPAIGKHVVNLLAANVGGGDARAAHTFLTGSCEEKQQVLPVFNYHVREREVDDPPMFLLSQTPQSCSFLAPLYEQRPYLYEIIY